MATRFGIAKADLFNLTIYDDPGSGVVEQFLNVELQSGAGSRRLDRVLADESNLVAVQLKDDGTPDLPVARPGGFGRRRGSFRSDRRSNQVQQIQRRPRQRRVNC